ncbi:hypothetical protein C8R44DRAFT_306929 [Mycena epipterygia]|nr:hypothetical protein C8R44DRAFT_306929 [Mycena epipterygia]
MHAILLLHNAIPNHQEFPLKDDTPQHRLIAYLKGVATTNAFSDVVGTDGTEGGFIVLAGSLFNNSPPNEANVRRKLNISTFKMDFTATSVVKEGEELTVHYGHTSEQVLKDNYGIF